MSGAVLIERPAVICPSKPQVLLCNQQQRSTFVVIHAAVHPRFVHRATARSLPRIAWCRIDHLFVRSEVTKLAVHNFLGSQTVHVSVTDNTDPFLLDVQEDER